jgi:phenylacetate-CoA ligase
METTSDLVGKAAAAGAAEPHGPDLAKRLVAAVRYCHGHSAYYRERLDEAGAAPEEIDSLAALADLPVLLDKESEAASQERSRIESGHPFGTHLCAPIDAVVGVASTSGTTGDPTYYAFTADDVALTDAQWAEAFLLGGVRPGDTVLHAFGLSMFLAGVPVVRALERMGARPVPVGAEAGSERLTKVARHMQPRAICCTPSYGEYLVGKGVAADFGVEHIFCAGEPGAGLPEVRERLSAGFGGATVTDVLGGVHGVINVSCEAHAGMHMLGQRHSIQQLMDPDTGAAIEPTDGATGVRVKTTLDWRAQPQLRASVGDVYEILTSPCECGRTEPRARVIGRVDDLLIVKGVKVYPATIQNLVFEFRPRLTGHFRIVLSERGPKVSPPLQMRVEVKDGAESTLEELSAVMHSRLAVTPEIEAVAPGSLPRESHKTQLISIEAGA